MRRLAVPAWRLGCSLIGGLRLATYRLLTPLTVRFATSQLTGRSTGPDREFQATSYRTGVTLRLRHLAGMGDDAASQMPDFRDVNVVPPCCGAIRAAGPGRPRLG